MVPPWSQLLQVISHVETGGQNDDLATNSVCVCVCTGISMPTLVSITTATQRELNSLTHTNISHRRQNSSDLGYLAASTANFKANGKGDLVGFTPTNIYMFINRNFRCPLHRNTSLQPYTSQHTGDTPPFQPESFSAATLKLTNTLSRCT